MVETGVYCLDAAEGGMLQSGREGPGPGLGVEQDWTELNWRSVQLVVQPRSPVSANQGRPGPGPPCWRQPLINLIYTSNL